MLRNILGLVSCACVATLTVAPAAGPPGRVTEEPLGEIGLGTPLDEVEAVVAPDGRRIAWRERQGERWTVRVNGVARGAPHDKIECCGVSADGQHVAYSAKDGKEWRVISDDVASAPYDEVSASHFSGDGGHVAFSAKRGKRWVVVVDGKEGPAYDAIGEPAFIGAEGERVVYPAKRRKQWVVVDGGEERGPEFKSIWIGEFTGGGYIIRGFPWLKVTTRQANLVYFAELEEGWAPVVRGRTGPAFDVVGWPVVFGAGEERTAYAGASISARFSGGEKAQGQVVVDGVAGPSYEGEPTEKAASGLLKGLAGVPQKGLARGVLPFGLSARAHGVSNPGVSPDGQHVAYAARRGPNDFVVVKDGTAGATFAAISCGPIFGEDGRLIYVGESAEGLVVVADEKRVAEVPWTGADCVSLRVAGEHVAFVARAGETFRVYIDGRTVGEHAASSVGKLVASIEGERAHVAYEVAYHDAAGKIRTSLVVIDGAEGPRYDDIVSHDLRVSPEGALTYVARKGRQFVRVTQVPET